MANLSSKTGYSPLQTQITLSNNATTSIQDFSAYEAQEITGFVYVDATTDLRCSFKVMVVKNGAGTWEVASSDQAGDNYLGAALLSFSMSGSVLRITLPNITPVFSSAYARYQLSAPYLGGNYPLSVSARQVVGDVSGVTVPAGYIGEAKVFTARAVTGSLGAWASNSTELTELSAGVWIVYARSTISFNNVASIVYSTVNTNSTADNSGQVALGGIQYNQVTTATSLTILPLAPISVINVSAAQKLYAKSYCEDAAVSVTIEGIAVRIA